METTRQAEESSPLVRSASAGGDENSSSKGYDSLTYSITPSARSTTIDGGSKTNTTTLTDDGDENDDADQSSSIFSLNEEHKTSVMETFIHLLKGYMGAGCLSLPWAMSQLGVFWGIVAIFAMSFWSSYNCWIVVKLKRYIERTSVNSDDRSSVSGTSTQSNMTYPEVGGWAYGTNFQSATSTAICTQQIAICTVFCSFVGENLLALLHSLNFYGIGHSGAISLVFPFLLGLSFIPSLKSLAPVMAAGTILLIGSFIAIGVIIKEEWDYRPDETPEIHPPLVPLSLCAILYSYEGICLILPVESAMKEPKHFKKVFISAMGCVALILSR